MKAAAALDRLRAAAPRIHALPFDAVRSGLARVMDAWADPESTFRRRLLAELPAAAGLSAPTVAAGLELAFARFDGEALRALVASELRGCEPAPPTGVTSVLHGGVIPMPSVSDLLAPLLLRSPVLSRPGRHDPLTPRLFEESVAAHAPELAEAIAVVEVARSDADGLAALLAAERVCITGGDDAVAAVRAGAARGTRVLAHGHKGSIAVLGERGGDVGERAEALAVDVALWDQLGCLSPVACFVLGPNTRSAAFAEALARALAARERAWPRGPIAPEVAAAIAHDRDAVELRAAAGQAVTLHAGDAWTVVGESDASPRGTPLHRFVRVHPATDLDGLVASLRPLRGSVAGIAHEALDDASLATLARALGASHTAPFGRLQAPPLDWARDGLGVLRALLD